MKMLPCSATIQMITRKIKHINIRHTRFKSYEKIVNVNALKKEYESTKLRACGFFFFSTRLFCWHVNESSSNVELTTNKKSHSSSCRIVWDVNLCKVSYRFGIAWHIIWSICSAHQQYPPISNVPFYFQFCLPFPVCLPAYIIAIFQYFGFEFYKYIVYAKRVKNIHAYRIRKVVCIK